MRSFLNDLLGVGLSKGIVIIVSLLNSVLIARLLGPSANGVISSLQVYPFLFMAIGSLGIRQATTFFVGKELYQLDEIKSAVTSIWLFTSALCVVFCFVLIRYFSSNGENLLLVALAISPIPFSLFATYNSGIFLGQNNIKTFNQINWIPPVIILLINAFLILVFKFEVAGVLIGNLSGQLVMFVILILKNDFLKYFSRNMNFDLVKSMLSLGLIYAFSLLLINLNYKIDIILLDKLSSNYEIGIYSKGAILMEYMWQIPQLLGVIVFARSSVSKNGKAFSIKVAQLLRLSLIVIFFFSILLYFFAPILITILFGKDFEGSTKVLQILLPGVFLLTMFKVLNMDLAGKGKPWIAIYAMLPALIINIILNIILIPDRGADGASLASTISYSLAAIIFVYAYSKEVKIRVFDILRLRSADFNFVHSILKK